MFKLKKPDDPSNPIVFLDIKIGVEHVGRIIIELWKKVVPRAAENFRALCTGEQGMGTLRKPLHYKGVRFHKVQRVFMAQGGDIVNNDGTSGESIYGPVFEDENFFLEHLEGAVSLANYGKKDTNNSQFFITTVDCSHLNGTNVVIGYVLRGLGVINEMEQYTTDEGSPIENIVIENCGEIKPGDDWGFCDNDETGDKLPPFPFDWEYNGKVNQCTVDEMINILDVIKISGNHFFSKNNLIEANRKYRKAQRYYNFFKNKLNSVDDRCKLDPFYVTNCVNIAAVELKLNGFNNVKYTCNEALRIDPNNVKALFRRAIAYIEMKNYEDAIEDLQKAHELSPENKQILQQQIIAKKLLNEYNKTQMVAFSKLFK